MTNEKLIADWNIAERAGLVRLRAEHEEENYFDVYGLPTAYVVSEYFDGEEWQSADSIGMCAGYENPLSPEENCYVPDLMRSALDLIPQQGEH